MFSAVLRPHDDKYLKYLHTYVLPPPDNEPKFCLYPPLFPSFGEIYILSQLSVEKIWKGSEEDLKLSW